ncbi:MAG TPA: hypothetical protein VK816_10530, partial [Jatrophihabitantaceae bacterium]|nr:hypothetical protein [Jatrophihabitantaceae bacterium]
VHLVVQRPGAATLANPVGLPAPVEAGAGTSSRVLPASASSLTIGSVRQGWLLSATLTGGGGADTSQATAWLYESPLPD